MKKYAPASTNDIRRRFLTSIIFEQKWADLTLGEVEAMLMISFFEQGALLHKVRITYAIAFSKLETLYGDSEVRTIDIYFMNRMIFPIQKNAYMSREYSLVGIFIPLYQSIDQPLYLYHAAVIYQRIGHREITAVSESHR